MACLLLLYWHNHFTTNGGPEIGHIPFIISRSPYSGGSIQLTLNVISQNIRCLHYLLVTQSWKRTTSTDYCWKHAKCMIAQHLLTMLNNSDTKWEQQRGQYWLINTHLFLSLSDEHTCTHTTCSCSHSHCDLVRLPSYKPALFYYGLTSHTAGFSPALFLDNTDICIWSTLACINWLDYYVVFIGILMSSSFKLPINSSKPKIQYQQYSHTAC